QLDAEADEWIGFAVDGAARLRALIDSLLAYSRVGRDERPSSKLDTNAVVHAAVAGLHVAIDSASAVIDVDTLPVVHGDAGELGRVFANLIANAIKFRTAGVLPIVRVRAERGDGEWRFVVSDNGVGIAPQHRERVFRLFQRLHRREQYEGTGMGLAICRKIVERGGGRIWVEDGAEGGAAFCFTVPDRQGVE
ncbi:MAG TPA: ATP-binding protein, partial [Acidimicrobiales bacterium]|nr:ATP-binding protein [Acidimicrobiales bacterium]